MFRSIKLITAAAGLLLGTASLAQAPSGAPAGSTGQCKDGSYWTGATKQGACRGHHGVQSWYGAAGPSGSAAAPAAAAAARQRGSVGARACGGGSASGCGGTRGVDEVLERDEVERTFGDGGARRRSWTGVGEQQLEGVSLSDGPLVREDEER